MAKAQMPFVKLYWLQIQEPQPDPGEPLTLDELVYRRAYSDQGPDFAVAHRIIKRTKTRIYVDVELHNEVSRAWWDVHPERRHCFTLDRATFERDGCAYGRRHGGLDKFYATEDAAIGH